MSGVRPWTCLLRRCPSAKRDASVRTACRLRPDLAVAEAVHDVVVHEAGRLHEGVADGGPDEAEAAALELPAHCARLLSLGRDLPECAPSVHPRLPADEAPQE